MSNTRQSQETPSGPSKNEGAQEVVKNAVEHPSEYGLRHWIGWILGPLCLSITLLLPAPSGLSTAGWHAAGMGALMAIWWITESIPVPATSLLPLVLVPLLSLGNIKEAAAPYANPIIFLFLGGFIITLAMQRWNLHRRIALNLLGWMGTRPSRIVGGFLLASSLITMWVSNTAVALMMYPIALSVTCLIPDHAAHSGSMKRFCAVLMLAVAYGSTTSGVATLVGSVPNALMVALVDETFHYQVGFGKWMLIGVTVSVIMVPIIYFVLTRVAFKLDREEVPGMKELISVEKRKLGPFSKGELAVTVVFVLTALSWVMQPFLKTKFPMVTDTMIAMAGALLLFMIPLEPRKGIFAMNWQAAKGLPWDALLLFGGGLSLAAAIDRHGFSKYLGDLFVSLTGLPTLLTVSIICFTVLAVTQFVSNTAVAVAFLPIVSAIAVSIGENPLLFLFVTAMAANCAYMLPVGTPPNAIVFGSGMVTLPQMARAGSWLVVAIIPVIVLVTVLVGHFVFGIDLGVLPDWAIKK